MIPNEYQRQIPKRGRATGLAAICRHRTIQGRTYATLTLGLTAIEALGKPRHVAIHFNPLQKKLLVLPAEDTPQSYALSGYLDRPRRLNVPAAISHTVALAHLHVYPATVAHGGIVIDLNQEAAWPQDSSEQPPNTSPAKSPPSSSATATRPISTPSCTTPTRAD